MAKAVITVEQYWPSAEKSVGEKAVVSQAKGLATLRSQLKKDRRCGFRGGAEWTLASEWWFSPRLFSLLTPGFLA